MNLLISDAAYDAGLPPLTPLDTVLNRVDDLAKTLSLKALANKDTFKVAIYLHGQLGSEQCLSEINEGINLLSYQNQRSRF